MDQVTIWWAIFSLSSLSILVTGTSSSGESVSLPDPGRGCQSLEGGFHCESSNEPNKWVDPSGSVAHSCNIATPCGPMGGHVIGMSLIPGKSLEMGTDEPIFPADGEHPQRQVTLDPFLLDQTQVSNSQFDGFVQQTGHVTTAEQMTDSFVLKALMDTNGPTVNQERKSVSSAPWWVSVQGANWKSPEGPGSDVSTRMDHPVVHVSWFDAMAYCAHHGKRLPTEAEWESGCRAGLKDRLFPWGNKWMPQGEYYANTWQGSFPHQDLGLDGFRGTCPVGSFPANKYGLHNMVGNVWEWTADWWTSIHSSEPSVNPKGPSFGTDRVKKGGSFMCHIDHCYRYRCSARHHNAPDSTASNLGFRCARSLNEGA